MELLKDNSHKTHNTNQTDCYGSETFVLRNHGGKGKRKGGGGQKEKSVDI